MVESASKRHAGELQRLRGLVMSDEVRTAMEGYANHLAKIKRLHRKIDHLQAKLDDLEALQDKWSDDCEALAGDLLELEGVPVEVAEWVNEQLDTVQENQRYCGL